MIPFYASNRATVAGWFAYEIPPGDRLLWTGDDMITIPSHRRIAVPDKVKNTLPNMYLVGFLDGEDFTVEAVPPRSFVTEFQKVYKPRTSVLTTVGLEGTASFYQELEAADKATLHPTVGIHILPDDPVAALDAFKSLGNNWLARHPESEWGVIRSPLLLSPARPLHEAVAEVIKYDPYTCIYTAFSVSGRTYKFTPIYVQDVNRAIPLGTILHLFLNNDEVLGYEAVS